LIAQRSKIHDGRNARICYATAHGETNSHTMTR